MDRVVAQIKIENLHKRFGDFIAVRNSTISVEDGEFFVMLGPSGCGKTTTLRMIAGLELPTSGNIFLDGKDVTFNRASERDIAFVFQLFALYPHMNVGRNIGFPLKCQGVPRREVRQRVLETAKLLRIDHLLNKPVSGLAGGDRQRVALGRAIVRRPDAFLMDEPLGTLDAEFRDLMRDELRQLHTRINATTVYVTHDQLEAMSMGDKIAVMNAGVVEQFGTPVDVYERPATMFVANFVGSPPMNLLPVSAPHARGQDHVIVDGAPIKVPPLVDDTDSDSLVVGVRPEHISLRDNDGKTHNSIAGRVFESEYLGTTQIVTVDTSLGRVKARVPARVAATPGEQVRLSPMTDRISLFDKTSGQAMQRISDVEARHG